MTSPAATTGAEQAHAEARETCERSKFSASMRKDHVGTMVVDSTVSINREARAEATLDGDDAWTLNGPSFTSHRFISDAIDRYR